jgi:rubrerythrin
MVVASASFTAAAARVTTTRVKLRRMSIVESLIRLVDPVQAREREAERRRVREEPKRERTTAPPSYVCRICGHQSPDKSYCPDCLADTMELIRRP